MAKLVWQVKLVAERHPGVVTEAELACLERDEDVGLADLGLRLDDAKQLTAALQTEMVQAQMATLGECPRACEACGRRLAAKGHFGATLRSLFGNVSTQVRRLFVCPCQYGKGEAKGSAVLGLGKDAVAPELAYVTARYAALAPFGKVAAPLSELLPLDLTGRSTPAQCGTGRSASAWQSCRRTPSNWMAATCATGTGAKGAASR